MTDNSRDRLNGQQPVLPCPSEVLDALAKARDAAGAVAAFESRIEELRREGVSSYPPLGGKTPWAETTETRKLDEIVWESWTVSHGSTVPGVAALAAIERNVDYAGLPAVQREMLEDLRARLDAGQFSGEQPEHKDLAGRSLARIVGVGEFEGMLTSWKESDDRPWAEVPEAVKVRVIVDVAQEAGPPGAYTLATIEREVDYDRLPPWRRQALEGLRARLDRGELNGENPDPSYQGDRAELALRLAELEARVEEDKRIGLVESRDRRIPWQSLGEEEKFDLIMGDIRELHLESELGAYGVLNREVDMTRPPEGRRAPLPSAGAIADDRDDMPTPEEWRKLKAEWTHDYGLRRIEDRGVKYEDEGERPLDHAAARSKSEGQGGEQGERLPLPGELAESRDDVRRITDEQIHRALADRHEIAITWSTVDVRHVRPNLDEEQAWEVLQQVKDIHDAEWGVSWATLATVADDLFPKRRENRTPSPGELAEDRGGPESPGPERGRKRGR